MSCFVGRIWFLTILALAIVTAPALAGNIFLLTYKNQQYDVERVNVPDGQTIVLQINPQDGILDVIRPVGPGGSGSVAKTGDGHTLIISCKADSIYYKVRQADGKETVFPTRALANLKKYDTRLSVSGADGSAANFLIKDYDSVIVDTVGPTIDLFGGMIPLAQGDFVLYTDTYRTTARPQVTGTIPIRYDRYIFVDVSGPGGRDGLFIIDIGAAKSIVVKDFVPVDQEIVEASMMEYSSAGARKLKYEPFGGTGPVTNIIGSTTMPYLAVGDVIFYSAEVSVIDQLPRIGGKRVDGIIGIDLLAAAPYLLLRYNRTADARPSLSLTKTSMTTGKDAIVLPYSSINGLFYVNGSINGTRVHFLLDSGAPNSFLGPGDVKLTGANISLDSAITYKGGGGQAAEGHVGILDHLHFGSDTFDDQIFAVGEIQVLKRLRKGEAGGLLGNAFFENFSAIEIDFDHRLVRFVK